MNRKIFIEVEGGVVQSVFGIPEGVQVEVLDYDTDGQEPGDECRCRQGQGNAHYHSTYQARKTEGGK